MYRTHTCGALRAANVGQTVTLAGWVQKVRNLGAMTFIDLRDRYGLTQIVVEEHSSEVPAKAGGGLQTRLCHERSDSRPGAAARNPAGCKGVKSHIATILQHRAAAARPCREREDYERIDQRQRSTAAAR